MTLKTWFQNSIPLAIWCIQYAAYSIWNHLKDFFIDELKGQKLKRDDYKKKNYIRPSAPSDCCSLDDQALAEDAASDGDDDSSGGSLGGVDCDDGGSTVRLFPRTRLVLVQRLKFKRFWSAYHWFKRWIQDNHWSWGEHEANDESETEEESDYSDASGISDDCESGEDEEEKSEEENKNQNAGESEDNEDNLFQEEDLRLIFEL